MVDGVRATGVSGPPPLDRDGTRPAAGRFAVDDGAMKPTQQARVSTVAGIGLESMLALQAVDEAIERDRSARRRGTAMLAALSKLQRAMLAEEDPSPVLRALNELATDGPAADDPELGAILRAVVLRTRVEIARRQLR